MTSSIKSPPTAQANEALPPVYPNFLNCHRLRSVPKIGVTKKQRKRTIIYNRAIQRISLITLAILYVRQPSFTSLSHCLFSGTEHSTMSNNDNSPPPTPTSARRASFSPGQKLSEIFGRSPPNSNGTSAYPGPISTSVANAQAQQRRRTSIAALTMAGSPTQTSPFAGVNNRQSSFSSSSSPATSVNENAIEEGDAEPPTSPTSPSAIARRLSFGARALRDVQAGNGTATGRPSTNMASAPSVKGRGLFSSHMHTAIHSL